MKKPLKEQIKKHCRFPRSLNKEVWYYKTRSNGSIELHKNLRDENDRYIAHAKIKLTKRQLRLILKDIK